MIIAIKHVKHAKYDFFSQYYQTVKSIFLRTRLFEDLLKIDTFVCINVLLVSLTIKNVEKISKALGDNNRLKILMHICRKGGSGQCSEIKDVTTLAQPSVSHHIKILMEAGLIEQEKEGRNHKYTLKQDILKDYLRFLDHLKS